MNKTRLNKIMLGIALTGLTGVAGAQWQVDIPTTATFTQTFAQVMNSLKASVDNTTTQLDIGRKQAAQLQADTDARQRYAAIEAKTAQDIAAIYPTLQACAEQSARQAGAGAMRASAAGGSSGGSPGARSAGGVALSLRTALDTAAFMVDQKSKLDTCSATDKGVANCGDSPGNYGGSPDGKIPGSDVSSLSIRGNTSNADKLDKTQEVANFTLDAKGIDVANQYIANATLYNAPKILPKDKMQADPTYKSLYDSVMVKLNGAQQAMKDILADRKANPAIASGGDSLAQQYWAQNKSAYQTVLGVKAPDAPSIADVIKFNAANDYVGTPQPTYEQQDEKQLLISLNQKIALSNLITSKQLSQQENTNILLSLLLTQQVAPADINKVNERYSKIMNTKTN